MRLEQPQPEPVVRFAVNLQTGDHVVLGEFEKFWKAMSHPTPEEYNTEDWCLGSCLKSTLADTVEEIMQMGLNEDPIPDMLAEDYEPEARPRNCPSYIYAT